MAKYNGQRVNLDSWDDKHFFVTSFSLGMDKEPVSPLAMMLHDHEMQEWVKDPKGMDANFVPDLVRPGKFCVASARR